MPAVSLAYKFRFYPTQEHIKIITTAFSNCRFVYNHFLALRKKVYEEEKRTLNYYDCGKLLTELKQTCVDEDGTKWLFGTHSRALEYALRDLDTAYKNFFRRVKQGGKPGYPRFKSRYGKVQSYKLGNKCIHIKDDRIYIPCLGKAPLHIHGYRPVLGKIQNVTISRSATNKYYVSICCSEVPIEVAPDTGKEIGIDLGLKYFCIDSEGNKVENPRYYEKYERRLKHLQRTVSRRKKGSNRYKRACLQVAKLHEKIADCRRNAQHDLSTKLVRENHMIALEDLAVANMTKNHRLAKHIQSVGWAEFRRQLSYKAEWHHRKLIVVDRFFPSSQLCSVCGARWEGTKDIGVREWVCPNCGTKHDRDINAAKNLLHEGQRILHQEEPIILDIATPTMEAVVV